MYLSHSYFNGDAVVRKIIKDVEFYEQDLFNGMCYINYCILEVMLNRSSDSRVSSGRNEIIAPITDLLVDVLIYMGLKGLLCTSDWDLASFLDAFIRVHGIYFDRIPKETEMRDIYFYCDLETGEVLPVLEENAHELCK